LTTVKIRNGSYRGTRVNDMMFTLVKDFQTGAKGNFVTVKSDGFFGDNVPENIRVTVESIADVEIASGARPTPAIAFNTESINRDAEAPADFILKETGPMVESDEQVMVRIGERFEILQQMTRAVISGDVRAMIVVGPPGVGKSYGVEFELEKSGLFDKLSGRKIKYEVVKGAMTPIGLYTTLYQHSDANNVLVFDDCDSVFQDELALNILKAALDSGKKRRIHWNSDSSMLRREGVPDVFDFKGGCIFITNLKFENIQSKKMKDHLEALQSRCHFLDLTLNTMRDKYLRIKQIFGQGQLFIDYDFTPEQGEEILEFMDENKNHLREMSLRMALKLADLTKVSGINWKALARSTCMKNS
jgi:hypothetical protein